MEGRVVHAVVVGADKLGAIPDMLANMGITIQKNITGRFAVHQRKLPALPAGTELLILFTDFLGHNVMRHFRELARLEKVPVVACRRSTVCLAQSLERCLANRRLESDRCAQGAARNSRMVPEKAAV